MPCNFYLTTIHYYLKVKNTNIWKQYFFLRNYLTKNDIFYILITNKWKKIEKKSM